MFGCRAIYQEGWKAVVYHPIQADEPGLDAAGWELCDLGSDPSECHDLAAAQPDRLRALVERWWAEAGRYQVLPLDNRPFFDRPSPVEGRRRYVYRPDRAPVPGSVAVNVKNRRHAITAYVEADGPGPLEGVLAVQGSVPGASRPPRRASQREEEARARTAREAYGPTIREAWGRLLADMVEVDPVEMVFEHERPLRVVAAIGTMRRHVDEWRAPLEFVDVDTP